jgi:adenine/guanine phosphoribosyltransferase-like PRPP-binding protein
VAIAPVLLLRLALPVLATSEPTEQTVTPITPQAEQRVEPVTPPGEQHVEMLDADGVQHVTSGTKNPVRRTADRAVKVVVGVVAAGVSIGAMVASLLFL